MIAADLSIDVGANGAFILQTADAAGSTAVIIQDNSGDGNWAYIHQAGTGAAMINQAGSGNVAMIIQK